MLVRLSAFAALLALILGATGCGGGGSSSGSSTEGERSGGELSKADFIKEADALCTVYHEEAVPIEMKFVEIEESGNAETPQNEAKLGELLKEAIGDAESEMTKIQALEPPKADAAKIEAMLGEAEEGNAVGFEAAEALEAGDSETFGKLAPKVETVNKKAKAAAESYGLKVCGQEPEAQKTK